MNIDDIVRKSQAGETLPPEELADLLALDPASPEAYAVMAEAARISRELSGGRAEIHAQFAVNLAPCPCDCLFCSFAMTNGVFTEAAELSPEQAVTQACRFEKDGANAVFMMSTARYPFELFLDISREVRKGLRPETTLVANIGDQTLKNALRLREAGFAGVYSRPPPEGRERHRTAGGKKNTEHQ